MGNKDLYSGFELALIPGLSILRRCLRREHCRPNAGVAQHRFDPARDIALLSVGAEYLHTPSVCEFRLYKFDQLAFLRIDRRFIQIWRICDKESFPTPGLLVLGYTPERPNRKGAIGI